MKIAVQFFGHLRTYEKCADNIKRSVIESSALLLLIFFLLNTFFNRSIYLQILRFVILTKIAAETYISCGEMYISTFCPNGNV